MEEMAEKWCPACGWSGDTEQTHCGPPCRNELVIGSGPPKGPGVWGALLWVIGGLQAVLGVFVGIAAGEVGAGLVVAIASVPVFALGSGLRGVQWLIDREAARG